MTNAQVPDSDELARFREQWRAEVRARTAASTEVEHPTSQPKDAANVATNSYLPKTPVELYRAAATAEEEGRLDEALVLYRQAFRKDPNVDKLYQREELAAQNAGSTANQAQTSSAIETDIDVELTRNFDRLNTQTASGMSAELQAVLEFFPGELVFISQDEKTLSPLQLLPLEIIVHILMQLALHNDTRTIERFASVSRKARAVSLDPAIWRHIVEKTYVPPQIARITVIEQIKADFNSNYRQIYIQYPRLRLDGVYIAVCHYIRPGSSDNPWINISHLITYHRYLRFLPGGEVLSLLANEDTSPQEVVHLLKSDLRMKGLLQGRWFLDRDIVHVTGLSDPHKPAGKYSFQMVLHLKSRPQGRWNKLDLRRYDSVELESGDIVPFSLKHERPFWFSKVKSY